MGMANLASGLWNWLYLKNELMELTDFLYAGANSYKLKGENWKWWKLKKIKHFGIGMVKNGCGQSCDGTLKLDVSKEWTDGVD